MEEDEDDYRMGEKKVKEEDCAYQNADEGYSSVMPDEPVYYSPRMTIAQRMRGFGGHDQYGGSGSMYGGEYEDEGCVDQGEFGEATSSRSRATGVKRQRRVMMDDGSAAAPAMDAREHVPTDDLGYDVGATLKIRLRPGASMASPATLMWRTPPAQCASDDYSRKRKFATEI